MPSSNGLRIGVFVDAENIRYNGGYQMRYDTLRRFAGRSGGTLLRLNTYVAFDQQRAEDDADYRKKATSYQQRVRDFGWKVIAKNVQRFTDDEGNVTMKANADLDMAVDAMLQAENLDQVLLVTGDGDFLQVVSALQNRGCRVELLAFRNVSRELQRRVDDFFSGYLVPDLLPFGGDGKNDWGQVGSYVRGVCSKWFPEKGYGFLRYLKRIDPNIWITDPRDPESPWESVFCHASELDNATVEQLLSRESVFEFCLKESDQKEGGRAASNVRLVT
ncbi:MAG: NYN domain-containing protein [Gammaproteobacteria bacterium]|nr:NYN domain-containing protein [Gammaproteobacteria bacterium]